MSLDNWAANLSQGVGLESAQYSAGIDLAVSVSSQYGNVSFTGHSLGGGIAAASAAVTGNSATVFNSTAVHANTVGRYGAALSGAPVRHYYSSFDVLQPLNDLTPFARVPGQQIPLGAAGLHRMAGVCRAMGC